MTVSVTDGELSDSETFQVTVNEVGSNVTPVLAAIEDQTINAESALSLTVTATDVDGDELTYSLDATSLGKGMTINASTGVFSWTPTSDQVGDHEVTVSVTDGELTDSKGFVITVNNITLGLDDISSIIIYPNPVVNSFQVLASDVVHIEVLTTDGQLVISQVNSGEVDMKNLASGTYLVKLISVRNKVEITRIIKR